MSLRKVVTIGSMYSVCTARPCSEVPEGGQALLFAKPVQALLLFDRRRQRVETRPCDVRGVSKRRRAFRRSRVLVGYRKDRAPRMAKIIPASHMLFPSVCVPVSSFPSFGHPRSPQSVSAPRMPQPRPHSCSAGAVAAASQPALLPSIHPCAGPAARGGGLHVRQRA